MSGTVAPSPVKVPRIVFTGVSGAAMTKMKEVCSECLCVMYVDTCIVCTIETLFYDFTEGMSCMKSFLYYVHACALFPS